MGDVLEIAAGQTIGMCARTKVRPPPPLRACTRVASLGPRCRTGSLQQRHRGARDMGAGSEVLKRGAPQQPRMQKSNKAPHSPQNNPTNTSDRSACRFGDMCKSARCPWYHPTESGTTRQPQREAGSDMLPPRRRTPAAVSMPAEKERARNWEERKQQSNWAQSRPTHGSETSPNRTHNNTQGNHEVRALQQLPNAAHAERAISKHPPPLPLQGAHGLHKGRG